MPKMRRKGAIHHGQPELNLTPLIDVVFALLAMFIFIAPLFEKNGIKLAEAGGVEREPFADTGPISLFVSEENTLLLDNEPVLLSELIDALKREKKRYPGAKLKVFHDRRAYFGTYQGIKNAAESAGFDNLELVLKPS